MAVFCRPFDGEHDLSGQVRQPFRNAKEEDRLRPEKLVRLGSTTPALLSPTWEKNDGQRPPSLFSASWNRSQQESFLNWAPGANKRFEPRTPRLTRRPFEEVSAYNTFRQPYASNRRAVLGDGSQGCSQALPPLVGPSVEDRF